MEKLKKEYSKLQSQITDCQAVIHIIKGMDENLVPKVRGGTKIPNKEVINYLFCLEENLGIELYNVEKQIIQKIFQLIEEGKSFYAEFQPYKYPTDSTNYLYTTKYLLCEYCGYYYLMSSNKNPNAETYLINISNNPESAIVGFHEKCLSFITIRKNIDARLDLASQKPAKLEKVEYNDIPNYRDIIKRFNKCNGCHPVGLL